MQGRRRPDTPMDRLPDDVQPGDYWKCQNADGSPHTVVNSSSNLTGTMWQFSPPIGGVGTMMKHTVRENEDGTINVLPNDGSSNSILFTIGDTGRSWHGYIYDGVWKEI